MGRWVAELEFLKHHMEMHQNQSLRHYLGPTDRQSAFSQDANAMCAHFKIWEALHPRPQSVSTWDD